MSLEITKSLKGALGELYYKEGSDQKGWAYISLENIHNSDFKDNVLVFKKGFHRIKIKIHDNLIREIKEISKPTNDSKENPSFVFDYLACKVSQRERYDGVLVANPTALCWVEVKTGRSGFSDNQVDALEKIKIPLALFYIQDVLAPPRKIEIEWDTRTGDEWLDELDDKRDQAESDDDFL
ncbi:hypothetical protein [Nitrososphaera sp.]|uniref:hypothetical protein n=1 Tax=Nitrososphaera sp. TaxID=1971748 RepID=UPI0017D8A75B|nr:hypothetical protein [Nitrososphaera sp.]NWG36711.1 hypothetical protein [Nitrososphaera sp.]